MSLLKASSMKQDMGEWKTRLKLAAKEIQSCYYYGNRIGLFHYDEAKEEFLQALNVGGLLTMW